MTCSSRSCSDVTSHTLHTLTVCSSVNYSVDRGCCKLITQRERVHVDLEYSQLAQLYTHTCHFRSTGANTLNKYDVTRKYSVSRELDRPEGVWS